MPELREELWDRLGQMAEGHFGGPEAEEGALPPVFLSFREFVGTVFPAFRWYAHNVLLAEVAQRIADGGLKRVMIWLPPGAGKSEVVSRLLSAYYLYRYPSREVGLVSYGADLAEGLAGDAREYFVAAGGMLSEATHAKGDWQTSAGGGMWGKGFAGPIRGRRFHLGIVDDPHKGPETLESDAERGKFMQWWNRTWLNRQNLFFAEGAAIVVVMQRLHELDLCAWLLAQPDAAQWTVVALDAIRSEEPWGVVEGTESGLPEGVEVWPDPRAVGELLIPEALTREKLDEQRAGNEDDYAAQFQQRPRKLAGKIFQRAWFDGCLVAEDGVPLLRSRALGVDLAVSTRDSADNTAAFPGGFGANDLLYLFRPVVGRMEAPDSRTAIAARAKEFRASVVGVESVAYQLSFVQDMRRAKIMAGVAIVPVPADVDKLARARGWAYLARDGRIRLVDDGSGWVEELLAELESFPRKKKDRVDAIGILIAVLRGLSGEGPLVGGASRTDGVAAGVRLGAAAPSGASVKAGLR